MGIKIEKCKLDVVLFDFGGVLAEEGFVEGLDAIAKKHGLDEKDFGELANDLIHTTGYLTGEGDEHTYWQTIRDKSGIEDSDETLRGEILSRFVLRPWMFAIVTQIRESGSSVAILSDQTNWLDELNHQDDFFRYFDVVFNSYHVGKSKVDPSLFSDIIARLGYAPDKMLFIDDKKGHCERARQKGMHALHFQDRERFLHDLDQYFPGISAQP